jgi:hypothetical protein
MAGLDDAEQALQGFMTAGQPRLAAAAFVGGQAAEQESVVARRAAEVAIAEKKEETAITDKVAYLENIPRTIIDKKTLDKFLSTVPREAWEDPPEESYLYTLKLYAETYGEGPGKAKRMGWWDFWYMSINRLSEGDIPSVEQLQAESDFVINEYATGQIPMYVPGPSSILDSAAIIQWRGPEPFAGDQCQTPVTQGSFAKQYVANMAFYREGLKPWQRGLEIGMAHGYLLIGPFVSLGPLRNTPEGATAGLLSGAAVVGIVSIGGLLFGSTIKPTLFDKPDDTPAAGFIEMINWHAVGGLGGAGFAHALITVFSS